ncbi:hypothetical protein G9P44_004624 [Scheffersomyces stipitis]|nr:hypothetical protein G9P44_004624 [Scheffersomyces stipitis]
MDDDTIATFLAVAGIDDEDTAKQFLELTNGDLEYAVTLYMESRQHGSAGSAPAASNDHSNDEELAQRLQNEAYSSNMEDNVRAADANVHRHETLVDSFGPSFGFHPSMHQPTSRPGDIFGRGNVGPFNQRFDRAENEFYLNRFEEIEDGDDDDEYHETANDYGEDLPVDDINDSEDEDDDIMELDEHGDVIPSRPAGRRRRLRSEREEELSSTQRRLANLFRPPFDLMSMVNLDEAKKKGKVENKWILINIQQTSEFKSHMLNRDFWSNSQVKAAVKENFIFLQYQSDSPNGVSYLNFYSSDDFPHIAILDPLTGERVYKWKDGEVPKVDEWLREVDEFLHTFSLLPNSDNPVVQHEVKFDPDALTEEQQIEFALKQSILENNGKSASDAIAIDDSDDENLPEIEDEEEEAPAPTEPTDPFESIAAISHEEPTSSNSTRIQVRFPNGKRLVHKFNLDDKVVTIFSWLKFILAESAQEYGLSADDRFGLSNSSQKSFKFIESLDTTIEEANLKNASILLEKE